MHVFSMLESTGHGRGDNLNLKKLSEKKIPAPLFTVRYYASFTFQWKANLL